jgi:DNA-binding transcriptional LysR family regulator
LDRLKGIEYFKRIRELGSFTAAANELGCSNAVISKYVNFLEEWVGAKLIVRNTRTISFTQEGERFYEYCCRSVEQTGAMLDMLDESAAPQGELVIAAPLSVSVRILAPLIADFRRDYPAIQLRLIMSDRKVDLVETGVDLAIRGVGESKDSALISTRLGDMPRVLVASPAYLQQHGTPVTVDDLARHHCLVFSLSTDSTAWEFVDPQAPSKTHIVHVQGPLVADNSLFIVEAARAGQGIASVPLAYVQQELAQGSLLQLNLNYQLAGRSLYALYPGRHYLPLRARLFIDYLKAAMTND